MDPFLFYHWKLSQTRIQNCVSCNSRKMGLWWLKQERVHSLIKPFAFCGSFLGPHRSLVRLWVAPCLQNVLSLSSYTQAINGCPTFPPTCYCWTLASTAAGKAASHEIKLLGPGLNPPTLRLRWGWFGPSTALSFFNAVPFFLGTPTLYELPFLGLRTNLKTLTPGSSQPPSTWSASSPGRTRRTTWAWRQPSSSWWPLHKIIGQCLGSALGHNLGNSVTTSFLYQFKGWAGVCLKVFCCTYLWTSLLTAFVKAIA